MLSTHLIPRWWWWLARAENVDVVPASGKRRQGPQLTSEVDSERAPRYVRNRPIIPDLLLLSYYGTGTLT